tara:strand:- start:626 stop:1066 length:441 start_codon:yes stop_codon:yes gene_type:complete
MADRYKLPRREHVFIESLMYHGFRKTRRRKNLKYKLGFVIPATKREDATGIDFWIKMPKDERLFAIQVTQRGVRMFRKFHRPSEEKLGEFLKRSEERVEQKRKLCKKYGIAFVLVRDYGGIHTNPQLAWGDIKALRYAIAHLKRWL